jgi:superfamily II DNA or RNA helicase
VLFTVPKIALVNQTIEAFEAEGITGIGAIQANHPRTDPLARLQVATVQSLGRRDLPSFGLCIVDECHERAQVVLDLMAKHPDRPFIGLSATPWARGMGLVWQDLVRPASIMELIEGGYLVPFRVFAPDNPDLSGVAVRNGDYVEAEAAEVMGGKAIVASVVETWLAKGEDRPTFVFAVNRAHAAFLHSSFEEAGIASAYVDMDVDMVEMAMIRDRFAAGAVRVVCSVIKMTTGVDWPMVACIVDAAPTRSVMRHVQKIGRGLRLFDGKRDCLILDHAGNTLRLGLVTDIEIERLDTTEPGEKQPRHELDREKQPKPCVECGVLHTGPICPHCGHERRHGRGGVKEVSGELVEFRSSGGRDAEALEVAQAKARFYGMALNMADRRGYNHGWAAHKFRERYGHWPDALPRHRVEPDRAFLNWEKSRRIAYAKARQKGSRR